ncbi:putative peroxisomal targeting receptor pex5 [Aspergillus rambellii]|uniref:Peroxisomal targeting signal receptor n=1 Tax=Aspergillus rambellii TaxID=308745 RepID=A0A0F8V278_9EURO|nr:putative peroxisomal targeting receptor pex5 [Aspergillus rambellii]
MSFLGGAECSTAGNPLTQFTKHVQDDKSLQRDRLVGRGPGMQEGMRSRGMMGGQDQMMDDFAQQSGQIPGAAPQPFAMEQLRRELDQFQTTPPRTGSPGWASEFDPGEQARMEAAFAGPQGPMMNNGSGFTPAEFARFQQQSTMGIPQSASPVTSAQSPMMAGFQRPMGMGYMGLGGMGMMQPGYGPMGMQQQQQQQPQQQQPAEATAQDKGKGRVVELDDGDWEAQFAEMETAGNQKLDDEANAAMEAELNDLDRSVPVTSSDNAQDHSNFESVWQRVQAEMDVHRKLAEGETDFNVTDSLHIGDAGEWDAFDTLNTRFRDPQLGEYMFEEDNVFSSVTNAFEEGMKIMREGGNLSLAALAFEAAVKKDPQHVQAWTMLGAAQAQNEKEIPAIRALEQALKVDPNNLDALMGLAVSYTNEGYDSTAYRTLERWLSVKYPQIVNPDNLSSDADLGFTDRQILHERVTDLFIQAAQLSPSGEQMDPDVQVGLGVLFYCAEEYDKAVDCFTTALASTESGTSNQKEQLHLLWNRLGATLANSGRSEEAIEAYEQALNINPNFVRARYNLGVSCINIGCYPEAAQHLLGALSMHRVVEQEGRERAREIVGGNDGGINDEQLERMIHISQNQSTNLYDTLRRVFSQMGRRDLADMVVAGMDVNAFRKEFEF